MTDEHRSHKDLIIAEEMRNEDNEFRSGSLHPSTYNMNEDIDVNVEEEEPEESNRTFFVELRNETHTTVFSPKGNTNDHQDTLPIQGSGHLDSCLLISPSKNFSMNVAIDDRDVVDDSFTTLSSIQDSLSNVSAYTTTEGDNVVSVNGYDFGESVHINIRPNEEITFNRIRVEGSIDE